jgi:hypothetical protein
MRTRDRMQAEITSPAEPPRPKTPEQLAGDAGLAEYNRLQERKAREEQERLGKIARRRQQEADEAVAKERKAKQAQNAFQEAAVIREASDLTADEAQLFWERLASMNALLDAGAASIVAEAIRTNRKVWEDL